MSSITTKNGINSHLSDSELPKAEEVELTPEELEFIHTAESQSTDGTGAESDSSKEKDKKVFSLSKGAVGAAVVGNKRMHYMYLFQP
jgi:hypothetical protein